VDKSHLSLSKNINKGQRNLKKGDIASVQKI